MPKNTMLEKIRNNPNILKENKEMLEDFLSYMQARDSKPRTIQKHTYAFKLIFECLEPNVELLKCDRKQIERLVGRINQLPQGKLTKTTCKITLKMVFKHFIGEDLYVPPAVAWIKKLNMQREHELTSSDLLTRDEINRMITNAMNLRDAAIIALMADVPLRSHEIILLKRKHLNLATEQPYLIVPENTKTGTRRLPIVDSLSRLTLYLNNFGDMLPDEPLFQDRTWSDKRKALTYDALRMMVKHVARRAGITKRIYPYLFRHTTITDLTSQGLNNATLEAVAGWTPGNTRMHANYQHLSESNIDDSMRKAKGLPPLKKDDVKAHLAQCPRCKYPAVSMDMRFCGRCGAPMNKEIAYELQNARENLQELAAERITNPELVMQEYIKQLKQLNMLKALDIKEKKKRV